MKIIIASLFALLLGACAGTRDRMDRAEDRFDRAGNRAEYNVDRTADRVGQKMDRAEDRLESRVDRTEDRVENRLDRTTDAPVTGSSMRESSTLSGSSTAAPRIHRGHTMNDHDKLLEMCESMDLGGDCEKAAMRCMGRSDDAATCLRNNPNN